MFPHRRMPSHVTVLYIYSVVSLLALFHAALVVAEVDVISSGNVTVQQIIDYELSIGAHVPDGGMKGRITTARPLDACEYISKPPYPSNSSLKWFVLIERASCSMQRQVLIAESAGYDAAIIYNKGINSLQPFSSRGQLSLASEITIPAVLIGERDGNDIKNHFLFDKGYILILYPDQVFNLNTYLLPFALVIGVCFILMLTFMVIKCIKDNRQRQRNKLSSKHLKQLPVNKFKKGDPYDVCAICLEDYTEGEKLRMLPCSHVYHTKCIDPWLTNNRRTCPVCKRKVILEGHQSETDSDSDQESTGETTPLLRTPNRRSNTVSVGGTFFNIITASVHTRPRPTHNEETTQTTPVPPEVTQDHPGTFQTTQAELHHSIEDRGVSDVVMEPATLHSVNGDEPEHPTIGDHVVLQNTGAESSQQLEQVV
ncbi:E3 ubiquitin-protein ligase RNF13-like isoform X2 [Limulus polyphemus]|uniref:E3 ubiquitin-protein ligase RNF13-like isoform X2 n=1 Tax=Limulus polyphemus TaxID=6850 RepID=A0ABM1BHG6_LIMPO|nr:E3 ubiquitin-protein ligase RNF13-like isoform X2 [Limulus polyphemus]